VADPAAPAAAAPEPQPDTLVAMFTRAISMPDESATPDESALAAESPVPDEASFEPAEEVEKEAEATTLLADPSDYSVARDRTIEVQAAETLGHYADWLDVRASQLRRINRLPYGTAIGIGHRIELDFSRVDAAEFERRRTLYHRELQEEFFSRYEIEGTKVHVTRRGDSIWMLAERKYRIPVWLLRQYNPDVDFAALHAGTKITVPRLRSRGDALSGSTSTTETATMNRPGSENATLMNSEIS